MELSRVYVDQLLDTYEHGENYLDASNLDSLRGFSLKMKLRETKILIDRWDKDTTHMFVHPTHSDLFWNKILTTSDNVISRAVNINRGLTNWFLWGAHVDFTESVPENICLMIALGNLRYEEIYKADGRSIAVARLDGLT